MLAAVDKTLDPDLKARLDELTARVPPGRRHALSPTRSPAPARILVWMCALMAINQLGFGAVVAVLALYARSFGVGQSAIGLSIAIYGLARFLVAVPAGRLADAAGRRAALALGGRVTAAGNLLCALAPTYAAVHRRLASWRAPAPPWS